MKNRYLYLIGVAFIIVCLLAFTLAKVQAQSGDGYDLTWNNQDGGGIIDSTGGSFQLSGTIGQPDASAALVGGTYDLVGGFWTGIDPFKRIYLPVTLK